MKDNKVAPLDRTNLRYKKLGGRPLTGASQKQINWGEEIRDNALYGMSENLAREVLKNRACGRAQLWIENRGNISFITNLARPYLTNDNSESLYEKEMREASEYIKKKEHYEKLAEKYGNKVKKIRISKRTKKRTVHVKINNSHVLVPNQKIMYQFMGVDLSQQSFTKFTLTETQLYELFYRIELTGERFEIKYRVMRKKVSD